MPFVVLRQLNIIDSLIQLFSANEHVLFGDIAPIMIGELKYDSIELTTKSYLEQIHRFCQSKVDDGDNFDFAYHWETKKLSIRPGDVIQIDNRVFKVTRQGFKEQKQEPLLVHVAHTILPPDGNEAEAREDFNSLTHKWVQDRSSIG